MYEYFTPYIIDDVWGTWDAIWEIDRTSQTLKFRWLVRTKEGIWGLVVSSIVHHIALESVLHMERMIRASNLDNARESTIFAWPRGSRPCNRHSPRVRVCVPHVPHYDNAGINKKGFEGIGHVASEEDPS